MTLFLLILLTPNNFNFKNIVNLNGNFICGSYFQQGTNNHGCKGSCNGCSIIFVIYKYGNNILLVLSTHKNLVSIRKFVKDNVPHLASLANTSALIILHCHIYIGKGWGTGVPHLASLTK